MANFKQIGFVSSILLLIFFIASCELFYPPLFYSGLVNKSTIAEAAGGEEVLYLQPAWWANGCLTETRTIPAETATMVW
jgi:hypothetical protein